MTVMKQNKKSMIILLLTSIFIVPMIAAWLAYSKGLLLTGNRVNRGMLLLPPLPIQSLALTDENRQLIDTRLKGKWWLMYLTQDPKDKLALRNLYYIRQIRQATGKDRDRIERAVITLAPDNRFDVWLQKNFPGTYHFTITDNKINQLEESTKKLALKKGSLYLVDPLGNIMLFYAPNAAPKGILKDLQRVLKVSQIG